MFDLNEGLAYVPVPMPYLAEVLRLVADRTGPATVADVADVGVSPLPEGTIGATSGGDPWTVAELSQIALGTTETTRVATKVMDVLAQRPGEHFSTTDLVDTLGVARNNLRGALSALTRHINKHYPNHWWPFRASWGGELGGGFEAEMYYRIDPETAAAWSEAHGA